MTTMAVIAAVILLLCAGHLTNAQSNRFEYTVGDLTSVSDIVIPSTSETVVLSTNQIGVLRDGDFETLSQCKNLHLAQNRIETIEDRAFRGLDNLENLFLHVNRLTTIPNLEDLPKLKELYIYNNDFTGALPANVDIGADNVLEKISVENMEITVVSESFFLNFPNLKVFIAGNNDIHEAPPVHAISDTLEVLDISDTEIFQLDPTFFKGDKPSVLREFIFKDARNTIDVNVDFFRELPNLETIDISYWQLTRFPDISDNVQILKNLKISRNPDLVDIDPIMLFGNPPDYSKSVALENLDLSYNALTSISGDLLSALTELKTLNLIGNQLETFPMERLGGLLNLDTISLESNRLSTVCDIGHRDKDELVIELGGNPLVCDTRLCWLFDSQYIFFDSSRVGVNFDTTPCDEPSNLRSRSWNNLIGTDLKCSGSSEPYGCSTPDPVEPVDPDPPGDGDSSENPTDPNSDPVDGEDDSGSDSSLVPVAAGAIGGVIVILIVVIGVVCYRMKSKKTPVEESGRREPTPRPPGVVQNVNIYISPGEKRVPDGGNRKSLDHFYQNSQTRSSNISNNEDYHEYTELDKRHSIVERGLGGIDEINIDTTFHNNGNI